jgi:cytochrome c biogenesis protein CcmG/thiol:disulfide interchange protein DsbE
LQLGLGSSGIPETFVVDGDGIIRYQHIGDIRADDVDEIYAAWEDAR